MNTGRRPSALARRLRTWIDARRHRGARPKVPDAATRALGLFTGWWDTRRATIARPNALPTTPTLQRRANSTSEGLQRWAVGQVDTVHASGGTDDAAYRLVDRRLGHLLHEEWARIDTGHVARLTVYQSLHTQQRSSVTQTEDRIAWLETQLAEVEWTEAWHRWLLLADFPLATSLASPAHHTSLDPSTPDLSPLRPPTPSKDHS